VGCLIDWAYFAKLSLQLCELELAKSLSWFLKKYYICILSKREYMQRLLSQKIRFFFLPLTLPLLIIGWFLLNRPKNTQKYTPKTKAKPTSPNVTEAKAAIELWGEPVPTQTLNPTQ
jgi:hypothetical protein